MCGSLELLHDSMIEMQIEFVEPLAEPFLSILGVCVCQMKSKIMKIKIHSLWENMRWCVLFQSLSTKVEKN